MPKPVAYIYNSTREIRILYRSSEVKRWKRLVKAIKKEIRKEAEKSR